MEEDSQGRDTREGRMGKERKEREMACIDHLYLSVPWASHTSAHLIPPTF
jgi:hypothetical protein